VGRPSPPVWAKLEGVQQVGLTQCPEYRIVHKLMGHLDRGEFPQDAQILQSVPCHGCVGEGEFREVRQVREFLSSRLR